MTLKKPVALFLTFFTVAVFCFADPAEGYWLSVDDQSGKVTAGWQIYLEGGKLFGKILSMSDYPNDVPAYPCKETYPGFPVSGRVNQMTVVGTPWIFGLSPERPGHWGGGSIINPEDGKMYHCKIIFRAANGNRFKADTLEVRGEIGLGIGRSQFWQKTDRQTASGLGPN
jgi:uncharacterized protein (DUF2147 family)